MGQQVFVVLQRVAARLSVLALMIGGVCWGLGWSAAMSQQYVVLDKDTDIRVGGETYRRTADGILGRFAGPTAVRLPADTVLTLPGDTSLTMKAGYIVIAEANTSAILTKSIKVQLVEGDSDQGTPPEEKSEPVKVTLLSGTPITLEQSTILRPSTPEGQDELSDQAKVRSLFAGVGLGLTHSLNSDRVSDTGVTIEELDDADKSLYVQVNESENTDVRVLFETHYLARDVSLGATLSCNVAHGEDCDISPGTRWFNAASDIAMCGPFAAVRGSRTGRSRGCGPFLAVAADTDGEIVEFGGGWFVGFGEGDQPSFGLGLGVIVDPDSSQIDYNIVNRDTMRVRDEFKSKVSDGDLSVLRKRASTSVMVMVSRHF